MPHGFPRSGPAAVPGTAVVVYRTDVQDAELIEDVPTHHDAVELGRQSLRDTGVDPDSWVDPETDAQLHRARPENTTRTILWGWGRWVHWCGLTGRLHLPAHPNSVRQFIKDHWEMRYPVNHPNPKKAGLKRGRRGQPYSPATVELAVYTVTMVHNRFGYPSPLRDPQVAQQIEGYRLDFERDGFRTNQADPLSHAQSVTLARAFDLGTVNGLRNAAMLRCHLDMGCRPTEWCAVLGQDVSWESEDFVRVTFVQTNTKTRQRRTVGMQAVPDVDGDVDPVALLRRYWQARAAAGWDGTGPLWVDVAGAPRAKNSFADDGVLAGRFLDNQYTRAAYEEMFKRVVAKTGIDRSPINPDMRVRHFTLMSMRSGLITGAADAGMPLEKVAKRTGHSPASPVIHGYFRSGRERDLDNPGVLIRRSAPPADPTKE